MSNGHPEWVELRLVPIICAECREKVLVPERDLEKDKPPAKCARCVETAEEERRRQAREVGGGKRRNPGRGHGMR